MDIAFVLPTISTVPSGGHKIVFDYANYLNRSGHSVTIYYITENLMKRRFRNERLRKAVCTFVAPRFPRWYKLERGIRVKSLFERRMPYNHDVVIATAVKTAYFLSEIKSGAEKAYFIQGFETWNATQEEVYNSYNLIRNKIVVSKWLLEIVRNHSCGNIKILSNPINTRIFKCDKSQKERIKHSLAFHYRTEKCKGSTYAIEVVKKLQEEYHDLSVFVVGISERPYDLPEYCKYYRKIKSEQIAEINNIVQVFLCTSIDEGFGLPGMEAMACGCALVSTDYPGVREYATDEYNALLSPARDTEMLVSNIEKLFEDIDLRDSLVSNGLKTTRNCSIENRGIELISILDEIKKESE